VNEFLGHYLENGPYVRIDWILGMIQIWEYLHFRSSAGFSLISRNEFQLWDILGCCWYPDWGLQSVNAL